MSALAADRKAATVADALIAADLDLAPDVGLDLAAEVTFDLVVGLDPVTELDEVVVTEVADAEVRAHPGVLQGLEGTGTPHAEDVGEGDLEALVARQVDPDETGHGRSCSFSSPEVSRVTVPTRPDGAPASGPGVQRRYQCWYRAVVRACWSNPAAACG